MRVWTAISLAFGCRLPGMVFKIENLLFDGFNRSCRDTKLIIQTSLVDHILITNYSLLNHLSANRLSPICVAISLLANALPSAVGQSGSAKTMWDFQPLTGFPACPLSRVLPRPM